MRAEYIWWFGLVLWGLLVLFWHPAPPVSYVQAASASPRPSGYRIFFELVEGEAAGVQRFLGSAAELPEEVGVLVVLSPSEPISDEDLREALDWVSGTGGTLVVGHPLIGERGEQLSNLSADAPWELSSWHALDQTRAASLSYMPFAADHSSDVPQFGHSLSGEMEISDHAGYPLLLAESGEVAVTVDIYGGGVVIQLAAAGILDNAALGWKQSHLFTAALIDEAGRKKKWAFDEAHEGIETNPRFMQLVAASPWRAVMLQVVLLILIGYWWRTARLGKPVRIVPRRQIREVTTQARDTGDFYRRSGMSRWALSKSLEYLKLALAERGRDSEARRRAQTAARQAEEALEKKKSDLDRDVRLIRLLAAAQHGLDQGSRGKG